MEFFPPAFYMVASILTWWLGFWPLFAPAAMTTACDELMDSIKELRPALLATSTEAGEQQGLRPAEDRVRIDALIHFASELNKGVGLAFTLRGKRVDAGSVTSALVWLTGSVMAIVGLACWQAGSLGV